MAFVNTDCGRRQKEVAQLSCPQPFNPLGLQNVASNSSMAKKLLNEERNLVFQGIKQRPTVSMLSPASLCT